MDFNIHNIQRQDGRRIEVIGNRFPLWGGIQLCHLHRTCQRTPRQSRPLCRSRSPRRQACQTTHRPRTLLIATLQICSLRHWSWRTVEPGSKNLSAASNAKFSLIQGHGAVMHGAAKITSFSLRQRSVCVPYPFVPDARLWNEMKMQARALLEGWQWKLSRKNICTNWTWCNGGCWGLLLAGFAYLMNLGKSRCGEWTKEWSTLLPYTHCSRGATNILLTNTVWHLRLLKSICMGCYGHCLDAFEWLGAQFSFRTIQKQRPTAKKVGSGTHIVLKYIFWRTKLVEGSPKLQPMVGCRVSICKILWIFVKNNTFPMSF